MTTATPQLDESVEAATDTVPASPWNVLLWNDEVNMFEYVTLVLQRTLNKPEEVCARLATQAHVEGKSIVFNGAKAEAEKITTQLTSASLWATMQKG